MKSRKRLNLQEATLQALANQLNEFEEEEDVKNDQVQGIMDGVLVITDPEISTEDYEEVIENAQQIIEETPEGEIPFDEEYLGQYAQTCPICGSTFVEDQVLEPGATCPICLEQPEAFVVVGKLDSDEEEIETIDEEITENEDGLQDQVTVHKDVASKEIGNGTLLNEEKEVVTETPIVPKDFGKARNIFMKQRNVLNTKADKRAKADIDKMLNRSTDKENIVEDKQLIEKSSITVTQDVDSKEQAQALVNEKSVFKKGQEVEVKDWNGKVYKVKKESFEPDVPYDLGKARNIFMKQRNTLDSKRDQIAKAETDDMLNEPTKELNIVESKLKESQDSKTTLETVTFDVKIPADKDREKKAQELASKLTSKHITPLKNTKTNKEQWSISGNLDQIKSFMKAYSKDDKELKELLNKIPEAIEKQIDYNNESATNANSYISKDILKDLDKSLNESYHYEDTKDGEESFKRAVLDAKIGSVSIDEVEDEDGKFYCVFLNHPDKEMDYYEVYQFEDKEEAEKSAEKAKDMLDKYVDLEEITTTFDENTDRVFSRITDKIVSKYSISESKNLNESMINLGGVEDRIKELGYAVTHDERDDEDKTLLVYREDVISENFDDQDNSELYDYLDGIPNVRYQLDDEDSTVLAVWLKEIEKESKKLNENLDYYLETLGLDPYEVDYSKNEDAEEIYDKFKEYDKLDSLFDYLCAGIVEPFKSVNDYLKYVAGTEIEDYEIYNGKLEESKVIKKETNASDLDSIYNRIDEADTLEEIQDVINDLIDLDSDIGDKIQNIYDSTGDNIEDLKNDILQALEDESGYLNESAILNHDNETCPKCGSGNYVETDQDEFDDHSTYKLICKDCNYESEVRERFDESYDKDADIVSAMKFTLDNLYKDIEKFEKPNDKSFVSSYYGSSPLVASVGNMLEYMPDHYRSEDSYGGPTIYDNVHAIKIGGAYLDNKEIKSLYKRCLEHLKDVNGGIYNSENKRGIIDDYGTNFSVIGFGTIVH